MIMGENDTEKACLKKEGTNFERDPD